MLIKRNIKLWKINLDSTVIQLYLLFFIGTVICDSSIHNCYFVKLFMVALYLGLYPHYKCLE